MRPRGVYLRLSVTDRCNLRCSYCRLPDAAPRPEPGLSNRELVQLVEQLARVVPLHKLRLTGGEPLVRPGLVQLVGALRGQLPGAELCLTTNGLLLDRQARPLKQAGLDRVNISLDTDDEARFAALAGGGSVRQVVQAIDAAHLAGFEQLKINVVLQRSINGDRLPALVRLAGDLGCELRFIELMPIGAAAATFAREHLPAAEALHLLERSLGYLGPLGREGTAARHLLHDGKREVTVGFITPVSAPFCSSCNRLRIDHRGQLLPCLRLERGVDLAAPLRAGQLSELERRIVAVLEQQPPADAWPHRPMVAIGG